MGRSAPSRHGAATAARRRRLAAVAASYTDRLIWALHHPLPDRRILAAQILGRHGDPAAVSALQGLLDDPDGYLAAAALVSLVALAGRDAAGDLLHHLAEHAGPAPLRAAARAILARSDR